MPTLQLTLVLAVVSAFISVEARAMAAKRRTLQGNDLPYPFEYGLAAEKRTLNNTERPNSFAQVQKNMDPIQARSQSHISGNPIYEKYELSNHKTLEQNTKLDSKDSFAFPEAHSGKQYSPLSVDATKDRVAQPEFSINNLDAFIDDQVFLPKKEKLIKHQLKSAELPYFRNHKSKINENIPWYKDSINEVNELSENPNIHYEEAMVKPPDQYIKHETILSVKKRAVSTSPVYNQNGANTKESEDSNSAAAKDGLSESKSAFERSGLRSFVFNPDAHPSEKFQECRTSMKQSGHCRYVQHCMVPSVLSSIQHFMDNVCIIERKFIGVCCSEFPVLKIHVNWPGGKGNISDVEVIVPKDCGIRTNMRIVGGMDADKKAWPWMVALLNNEKQFFCGGVLLNNRYALTASHCTIGPPSNQILARVGEHDFKDSRDPHHDYRVVEIKRHGQYSNFRLRNDIALLKLEKSVVFNEFVSPICLPQSKNYLNKTVTLAGWGLLDGEGLPSHLLKEATFPIISNSACAKSHGMTISPSVICATAPSNDKGACNGDSGGPLMLLDDELWTVVGIVSWGRRGCNTKFPTAYTRVSHYLDWIKEHSG